MSVSQSQIAARLRVSQRTVSSALRDNGRVSDQTRRRVRDMAQQMGYRLNAGAAQMKSGRVHALALLTSPERGRSAVPPLFLGELHAQLAQRKMHLVASETPDAQLQDEAFVPHVLQHLSSDALIIYYTQDIPPRLVEMVHQHRVPAVWVNSQQPANAVLPDEARGGALAAEHLLGLGHRRVAYLTAPPIRHFSDRARRDALAASLAEAGVELTTIQLSRDEPLDVRRCRLTQAISAADRPTAVVCYKPREARLLHMTATLAGLNAPRDLSILTFGDAVTDDTGLPLTTVQVPQVQLAREVVAMAMQQIEQPSRPLTPRLIPPTLRPAESTTTAPTD